MTDNCLACKILNCEESAGSVLLFGFGNSNKGLNKMFAFLMCSFEMKDCLLVQY